jgi:Suppressor of fused protein (SUFU)
MAKLVLDHGADINQPFLVEGLPPRNVLSEAIGRGHTALVEVLKSRGAKLPEGPAGRGERIQPDFEVGDYTNELVDHFAKHYGDPVPEVVYEIVPSTDSLIEVHYIPFSARGDSSVLFTTGLSVVDLPVPKGAEQYRRAELMLELEKNWPRPEEALKSERWAWPIKWLRKIAQYAANSGNWLGAGFTTLVDEEPPKPLARGLNFTAWLLASLSSDVTVIHCKDGTRIQIYQLFPLYNEEYLYAREHGTEALMSLIVERKIETYIDLERPNVAIS